MGSRVFTGLGGVDTAMLQLGCKHQILPVRAYKLIWGIGDLVSQGEYARNTRYTPPCGERCLNKGSLPDASRHIVITDLTYLRNVRSTPCHCNGDIVHWTDSSVPRTPARPSVTAGCIAPPLPAAQEALWSIRMGITRVSGVLTYRRSFRVRNLLGINISRTQQPE